MQPTPRLHAHAASAGAALAALAIAAGAFGAHALKARLTEQQLGWWHTAAEYHLVHALALFALGLFLQVAPPHRPKLVTWSIALLLAGQLLFAGSLYAMALTDVRALGAVTPFGGTGWIVAWVLLALALRPGRASRPIGEGGR